MKLQLFCLLLTFSVTTFASPFELSLKEAINYDNSEIITGERKANIIQALSQELRNPDIVCTSKQNNSADSLELKNSFISSLNYKNLVLSINSSGDQPILNADFKTVKKDIELSFKFTTTSDLKKLLKVDFLKTQIDVEESNIGTILEPNYVAVEQRTEVLSTTCKAKD